jgi:hypothetical protein
MANSQIIEATAQFYRFVKEYPNAFLNQANVLHYLTNHLEKELPDTYTNKNDQRIKPLQIDYPSFFRLDRKLTLRRSQDKKIRRTRYDLVWLNPDTVQEHSIDTLSNRSPRKSDDLANTPDFFCGVWECMYVRNGFNQARLEQMRRNLYTLALTNESPEKYLICYARITTKNESAWHRTWKRTKDVLDQDRFKDVNKLILFKNYSHDFETPEHYIHGEWTSELESIISGKD